MDFNKIKIFQVVVESGSVSGAARKLHRTQSAISQQIQGLESELGLSLFESLRGSLLLTREGRQIYENVGSHFQAIENCVLTSQQKLEDLRGTIRIGTTPSIGHYFLPSIISKFKKSNQKVNIELVLQPDERIEQLLRDDLIDVGFVINFDSRKLFNTAPFTSFEETLVCSKEYMQKFGHKTWSLSHLTELDFIDFDFDAPNISHWLKKNTPKYRSIVSNSSSIVVVEDNESVKRMVLSNLGSAMLPDYMIEDEINARKLVRLFPMATPTKVSVDTATRARKNHSVCLKTFLDCLEINN